MKLTRFRIQNYKVIDDTGWVNLDADVTALVGKNESGKTAILRALWKSKNVSGSKFDKLYDYPRDRYSKERKATQEVVSLELILDNAEAEELVSKLPARPGELPSKVICTTKYQGEDYATTEVKFGDAIEEICLRPAKDARDAIQVVADAIALSSGNLHDGLATALNQSLIRLEPLQYLWDTLTLQSLQEFHTAVTQWIEQDTAARSGIAQAERTKLDEVLTLALQGNRLPAAEILQEVVDGEFFRRRRLGI